MQARTARLICSIVCLALAIPVFAQYGHPLKGSWSGEWWVVKGKENRVLLDFNWDGKVLSGTLDPGPDQSPMKNLTLTPPDVIAAGKAAIAARDAALAKQAADAAAGTVTPAAPATTAGTAAKSPAPAATAGTASKTAPAATGTTKTATAAAGRGAAPAAPKDNVAIASDPWILHFEADAKDAAGKTVKVVVDGKMENLGAAYTRVITGKWQQGTQTGSFKVTRN